MRARGRRTAGPEAPPAASCAILPGVTEPMHADARARTRRATDRRPIDSERTIVLALGAFGWIIAFHDCPEVVDGLEAILIGWQLRRLSSPVRRRPDAQISRTRTGFTGSSERMPKPELW